MKSIQTRISAVLAIFVTGVLVIYTQRIELIAIPMAMVLIALMMRGFRTAVVITTWVLILFLSRIPVTFFGFGYFSYVAYFCVFATSCAFLARMISLQRRQFVSREIWMVGLFALPITIGAVQGLQHLHEIPWHMLAAWMDVSLDARAYLRTFYFAPMFMPLLAVLIAGAVTRGLDPERLFRPVLALAWLFAIFVPAYIAVTGLSLSELVEFSESSRAEYLAEEGGLHPNVYGLYCAMVYAFLLGSYHTLAQGHRRFALATMVASTLVILLTFSRSALVAFALVNALHFWRIELPKKMAVVALVFVALALLPEALFERFQLGADTGDLDRFSSGRVENIWLPLLPDVADNWLLGQGHHSIYWTNAQKMSEIYPVTHSHNAFIDLLLDYGIWGMAIIVSFYAYVWRKFLVHAITDPSARLRGFFSGGHLAMVVLLSTTLNGRLTPELSHFPLWVAIGILLGRLSMLKGQATTRADLKELQSRGAA